MNGNVKLYGPCDIEIHIGNDNNYYALDLARLWVPECIYLFIYLF